MPSEITLDKTEGTRVVARPLWQEWCAFVTDFSTMVLVFAGLAAISGWIWPNKTGAAHFGTLLLFVTWVAAAGKLEIFGKRQAVPGRGRYWLAAQFLFYFVGWSSLSIVFDVWQGHTVRRVNVMSACVAGLFYAAGMLWVVPRLPSQRKDPFTTKRNFPNPGN